MFLSVELLSNKKETNFDSWFLQTIRCQIKFLVQNFLP